MSQKIVREVLTAPAYKQLWTANYHPVLPVSMQDFSLDAVLPAVLYMFRWAQRRGRGKFLEIFENQAASDRKPTATAAGIAEKLAATPGFEGFDSPVGHAILGDFLLGFNLENNLRKPGRHESVIRVVPTHYMSSWIDLPESVGHLRMIPEALVALLVNQDKGERISPKEQKKTHFRIGDKFQENVLLQAFSSGMGLKEGKPAADHSSDLFDESTPVGIDQLITIRLAQQLGTAPKTMAGQASSITNQRPIAEKATAHCSEDLRRFITAYSGTIPRRAFLPMLETCMALGLSSIFTASMSAVTNWAVDGHLPEPAKTLPHAFFVDASNGTNFKLRRAAEHSFDNFLTLLERVPAILMTLRVLDIHVSHDPKLKQDLPAKAPNAREWINLLGDVVNGRHSRSDFILETIDLKCSSLADALEDDKDTRTPQILRDDAEQRPSAWRLGEALSVMMGRNKQFETTIKCLDSSLMAARPHGFVRKQRVPSKDPYSRAAKRDARSINLRNTALEFLVHLLTLKPRHSQGQCSVSYQEFLDILRTRYSLYIDKAPPGQEIPQELLQLNKTILERRLRDLGLLEGVNDAEKMKRLVHRFPAGTPSVAAKAN